MPVGNRVDDAPMLEIDLPEIIKSIRNEKIARPGRSRNFVAGFIFIPIRRLFNSLLGWVEMIQYSATGNISLKLLEGHMIIENDKHSLNLGIGQILLLDLNRKCCVRAKEDTVFLLTLNNKSSKYYS